MELNKIKCIKHLVHFFHLVSFLGSSVVNNLPANASDTETQVRSLAGGEALEEETATHSSISAWRILQTEESGGLWSTGLQKSRTQLRDWGRTQIAEVWTYLRAGRVCLEPLLGSAGFPTIVNGIIIHWVIQTTNSSLSLTSNVWWVTKSAGCCLISTSPIYPLLPPSLQALWEPGTCLRGARWGPQHTGRGWAWSRCFMAVE